jgi:hypothetical protein
MTLKHSLIVIAGLDPAIQDNRTEAAPVDRRVKPGDDTRVVLCGLD